MTLSQRNREKYKEKERMEVNVILEKLYTV